MSSVVNNALKSVVKQLRSRRLNTICILFQGPSDGNFLENFAESLNSLSVIDATIQARYAFQMKTAPHLISAIKSGDLFAMSDLDAHDRPEIVLLFKDQAFCHLTCSTTGTPRATIVNGTVVRLLPSPGIRNGFQITCSTAEDATMIADALQALIDSAYSDMFDV